MRLHRRIGMLACVLGVMGLVWTAAPSQAEAKLLELQLRVHGGGIAGLYGTEEYDPYYATQAEKDATGEDFFKARRGAAFGAILNVEVLFIDFTYEFYQLADANGLSSTLNNFLVGFDWDFKASEKWVVTPYLLAGFGLATQNSSWLEKEHPQIALEDLQSRLVMARLGLQIEVKLGRFFRFGLDVGFGYHYGINNLSTADNDLTGHSHGFHITGNISFAFVWNVFEKKKKKKEPPKVIIISPAGVGTAPGPAPAPAPGLRTAPGTKPAPGTQPGPAPTPEPRTTPPPTTPEQPTPPPSRPTEAPPRTKKRAVPEPPPAR